MSDHSHIQNWKQYERWHDLCNAVCNAQGHLGNSELSFLLCKAQRKSEQKHIEAAARNLSNWRTGTNTPSKRNARLLADVLNINDDDVLSKQWWELYKRSHSRNTSPYASKPSNEHEIQKSALKRLTIAGVGVLVVSGAFFLTQSGSDAANDQDAAMRLNNIPWTRNVSLHVGEEAVVHGKRGDCGQLPKAEDKIQKDLPNHLTTGVLSTGKLGMRTSRRCDGATPAREIVFKALYPGRETFFLYGDDITVTGVE